MAAATTIAGRQSNLPKMVSPLAVAAVASVPQAAFVTVTMAAAAAALHFVHGLSFFWEVLLMHN